MAKRYELIVFDWDGTLWDSARIIADALQSAARDLGLTPPSDEDAFHIIGLGWEEALRHALPDLDPVRYRECAARYREHYLARDAGLSLFNGAARMVEQLNAAGHLLGVATGKSRSGLDRALSDSGLRSLFHGSRCADECFSKPHPQMLLELQEEFGIDPGAMLMVGDTTHDLQMARNAGVDALAVAYGAHPKSRLAAESPLRCFDSVGELAAWLRANA